MQWLRRASAARHRRSHAGHPLAAGPLRHRGLPREQLIDALARAEDELPRRLDGSRCPRASCTCRSRGTTPRRGSRSRSTCKSVRPDAPWCPSNIEFIRRINGLDERSTTCDDIVFDASYLVLGLGDVYLGAPVATPLDPRHRLVTTKYNPARTWTPENAVGIGGAYLCVYGMEGPGRLSVRRPHGADVEPLSRHARVRAGKPVAAAVLRSDPLLPGRRGRAARDARRLPAAAAAARDRGDDVLARALQPLPRRASRGHRGVQARSKPRSTPSGGAGRTPAKRTRRPSMRFRTSPKRSRSRTARSRSKATCMAWSGSSR